jgi:hypothetical protein
MDGTTRDIIQTIQGSLIKAEIEASLRDPQTAYGDFTGGGFAPALRMTKLAHAGALTPATGSQATETLRKRDTDEASEGDALQKAMRRALDPARSRLIFSREFGVHQP